jgi:hypothetical protein
MEAKTVRKATLCFLLLSAVLLLAVSSFADAIINNFNGYNDQWSAFGDPANATQTYGEVFTVPDGVNNISSFSFYFGNSIDSGNIIFGDYIATWTGTHAGSLLYQNGPFDYDNVGDQTVILFTAGHGGVAVTPGQQYVMFLSTSQFHGQSFGSTYSSSGDPNDNLNGFAYFNNGSNFNELFTNSWDNFGLQPDLAVDIRFNNAPEPGSLILLGTGILGGLGVLRRKLAA